MTRNALFNRLFMMVTTSFFLFLTSSPLYAEEATEVEVVEESVASDIEEGRSFLVGALLYLPNRLFDALDIFRARLRVGPGFGVGVRVTKPLSAEVGSYATIFAGLPGPRGKPTISLPVGAELYSGVQASIVAVETKSFGPNYSSTEIGADVQLLILGVAVGFDPIELVDFVVGFVGFDIRDDDL